MFCLQCSMLIWRKDTNFSSNSQTFSCNFANDALSAPFVYAYRMNSRPTTKRGWSFRKSLPQR